MNRDLDLIGTVDAAAILEVDPTTVSRWSDDRLRDEERRLTPAMRMRGKTGAKLFRRGDVEALRDRLANKEAASA